MYVYRIHVRYTASNMNIWLLYSRVNPLKYLISDCFSGCVTYGAVKTILDEQFSPLRHPHPEELCAPGTHIFFSVLFCSYLLFFSLLGLNTRQGATTKRKGLFAYSFRICGPSLRGIQGGRHLSGGEDEVCCLDSYYGGQEAEKEQRLGPGYKTP